MKIRAKLKVVKVEATESYENVTLNAVYSNDRNSENYSFSEATPSANLQMVISNRAVWGEFKAGDEFIVTFDKVPKA